MSKSKRIEDTYKKLSQREHVLHRSGMYIGSVKKQTEELWIADESSDGTIKMKKKMIEYSPGFMKIFDEILTNATDHSFRDPTVNMIKVDYDQNTGEITVWNNGSGIPVKLHKEYNMYVPELIFGHLLSGSNYDDNSVRTGAGTNGLGSKCHLHSTLIPLFNGEIKKASEINIGDILIGDDGTPRKVLNKIDGFGEMYKIIQHYGEDYVVNNNHTLTLHMPDHKVIFWNTNGWSSIWWNNDKKCIETKFIKVFSNKIKCPECHIELNSRLTRHYKRQHKDKEIPKSLRKTPTCGDMTIPIVKEKYDEMQAFLNTIPFESVFDINIQDYLKLNKTTQRRMAGVRGECVQFEEQEVELDPYILGLWLGDGMKHGREFTCFGEKDPEIINYFEEWSEQNDIIFKKKKCTKYVYGIHSKSKFGKKNSSPLRNILKKYNLIDNKHIPKCYLINSRENRLRLLAGLIDTDGYTTRDGTRINIIQSHVHKKLVDDIIYLARSLGFFCCIYSYMAKYKLDNGEERESLAYKINISGNVNDIPTLLPRKKCKNTKKQNTDKSTGYIQIKKEPDDKYIGLHVDGNQRYVINDFTVTHNCTNIYSKKFVIETIDSDEKRRFIQEFSNNMLERTEPKITSNSGKSFTKISFIPDYQRFGMKGLENDTILLIRKRVLDCIACTNANVQIYLNGERLRGKCLSDYIRYFFDDEKIITESHNERIKNKNGQITEYIWEYAIVPFANFEQVSFVNGNDTNQGGKHVDYILYQIINKYKKVLEDKKRLKDLKPNFIKDKLFLFLRATVANPTFNSQTKEQLTTPSKDFGCSITVSDAFITKLYKSSITDEIVEIYKIKETLDLAKKTDGSKKNKIYVPKLEDAIWAGTAKSNQCILILTEGLSAMTFALWGRSIIGPEKFGVFPLKGKCLNIRDATASQLTNNEEINNLKQIIGLKQGREYKDTSELRYGKIMILTDSDVDGSHIKGLLVNLFHYWWPNLLKLNFIQTLRTPIVKAIKGKKVVEFYTQQDYNKWKDTTETNGYTIRYYKGLGTSTKDDAQNTFKRINELQVDYFYKDENCDKSILLAFEKDKNIKVKSDEAVSDDTDIYVTCTDKRKQWLGKYDKNSYIDVKDNRVSYQDFIHKELIHFSIYDNLRSIPSLCDGLKPSQRKIIYYMLKKNITKSIKVAQLSGYISAETSYHHGEVSLQQAIIGLAQDFIGSNNINLLYPDGNFGSLLAGGKDAASPRYIFTKLQEIAFKIFDKRDSNLLKYLNDDGIDIEPEWFIPVLPMILVNGCEGIGTGYSTYIPPYNPKDIISNIIRIMDDKSPLPMKPYFRNYNGLLEEVDRGSYITKGKWERLSDTQIKITEIPIGTWVTTYKEFLESLIESNTNSNNNKNSKSTKKSKSRNILLKDVKNKTRDESKDICFIIEFKSAYDLDDLIKSKTIEKYLKLSKGFNINNMYLFDDDLVLTKYNNPNDILLDFYDIRLHYYQLRKEYLVKKLTNEVLLLKSKARFINEYINGILDINRKSKDYIIELLEEKKYPKLSYTDDNSDETNTNTKSYDYLIKMQLISLTKEKINELENLKNQREQELNILKSTTEKDLWKSDLDSILKLL